MLKPAWSSWKRRTCLYWLRPRLRFITIGVFARLISRLVVVEIPAGGCAVNALTHMPAAFAFLVSAPGCSIAP